MAKATNDERPVDLAPTSAADASLNKLLPLAWPLFAVMWLLFPVASVVDVLLRTDLAPVRLFAFLASVAAYVAVYLWVVLRYPFRGDDSSLAEPRSWIALLAALALYLELSFGSGIPYHFMFVVIAAAVALPTRRAAWMVVAIVALTSGIYALRSGWDALLSTWESAIAPFVIVGFSMIMVSRLVLTARELRAAREEIARLAVAEERLRFARDLHDLLGHSLSAIALKAALAARLLPAVPETEGAAKEIRDVEGVARGALREVREAVAGYRRPTLTEELDGARGMLKAAGVACRLVDAAGELPARTDAVLAWAVREGTTNVIRHSGARRCEIRLEMNAGKIEAEIGDDGCGPEGEESTGSGLSGLSERVAHEGGVLEAGPGPDGGFRLRVVLPLPGDASGYLSAKKTIHGRGRSS